MSKPIQLTIPHNYTPRPYQVPFWRAMVEQGKKRAMLVWHRRSGKDKTALNFTIAKMVERVGLYFYIFPTFSQAKRVLWDGIGADGFRFMDHFPPELVENRNETEMKITLKGGSIFQLVGADGDGINRLVGTNPVGVVLSEYSLISEKAWEYLRPILRENGGWAVFIFTPRGKNHAYELMQAVKDREDWFTQTLTIADTGVLDETDMAAERAEGMDEQLLQQEYFCDFAGGLSGSYYAKQVTDAEKAGRIRRIDWEPQLPVMTYWDLGVGDSTAIWFVQQLGRERRLIDYHEASGEGFPYYARVLKDKPYVYGAHYGPHDLSVRELSTGLSRVDAAAKLGIRFRVLPKAPIEEGIEAVRRIFPRCWFDAERCKRGLKALTHYHKELDEERKQWKLKPFHDWSSNAADAFRYFAMGDRDERDQPVHVRAEADFDIFARTPPPTQEQEHWLR